MTTAPPPAESGRGWGPGPALLLLLALTLAVEGMAGTFGGPFARGWLGHNGARYSQIGRNHERLGLMHLRAAPLLDAEPAAQAPPGDGQPGPPPRPDVYAHHPPGLGLTLGAVFRVFGVGEDAARAVPATATLLALLLLAWLVAGVAGAPSGSGAGTGALAALIAASMPMVSVYGAHVDVQGPPVLLLSLATLWAYRRWLQGGGVLPLLVASAAASAFDWYGLYAPAGCALHLGITQPARRRAALGLAAWTGLLFVGWLTWLLTLPGMSRDVLGEAAGVRGWGQLLALRDQLGPGLEAWSLETHRLLMPAWALFVLLFLLWLVVPPPGDRRAPGARGPLGRTGLSALLLLPPLVHGLVFPTGMLQHGYWLFALPYGLAAMMALYLRRIWSGGRRWQRVLAVAWVLMLVVVGRHQTAQLLAPAGVDSMPALVGTGIHEQTTPGDVVLTSFDCNPLEPGRAAGYVLKHPAVTFYADRTVRGGIGSPAELERALELVPGATWFLLTPPPDGWVGGQPDPALAAAVAARSTGEPRVLSGDPPVSLHRLAR